MSDRPPSEVPKDIAVRKGVGGGEAGQRDLLGDLYAPAAAGEERAGIAVVHGGGWRRGRPEGVRGFGERLAQAGFVCLRVAYRLTPEAIWPAADYERASPIAYDLTRFPPCMLIHGMEDAAVPVADTIAFRDKLARLGRPVSMHLFAGEGHAFDRKTAEGGPRMVSVADPRSVYGGAVVGLITLFFRKYLARDAVAGVARKEARCLSLA